VRARVDVFLRLCSFLSMCFQKPVHFHGFCLQWAKGLARHQGAKMVQQLDTPHQFELFGSAKTSLRAIRNYLANFLLFWPILLSDQK
jgi:hypothetical protein